MPIAVESRLDILEILLTPVAWIPGMQQWLIEFMSNSSSGWVAAGKFFLLLFPLALFVSAMWCTMLSLYTIPFRSHRISFAATMLVAWWDAARSVWLFWVGLFRFGLVALGWLFNLGRLGIKLVVEVISQLVVAPFAMTGRLSRNYFQPGVPWIAFLLLLGWGLLEATIFTYVMYPTVAEVLTDLVGVQAPALTGPVLYMFLLLLILGSFAVLQALLDSIKQRQFKFIVQMLAVELFVMSFEVMFLYRELVDAITPWIAQQTGQRLGIVPVLAIATFGWIGIRGMTWFLFAQFGTPPLLAFISRQPMQQHASAENAQMPQETRNWWAAPLHDFKLELDWLHHKSNELIEYLTLPVLQVLAAILNFAMIVLMAKPLFSLPLKSLGEVMETREVLSQLRMQPRKMES